MSTKKVSTSASKKKKATPTSAENEVSLREYQTILATAEEVAQIGSWKWDLLTQKVTWSDEMFRLFGMDREGFDGDVNRIVAERIHPQDAAAVAEANRRVLEEAQSIPLSYRIVLPDGTERTVWAQGKLIRDEDGKPIALTGFVQDITERVRADKQLLQMKRLYATLSQVNQMIVRIKDHAALYQVMCNVAVQFGEFPLAWVGLLDEASGEVRPVAACGEDLEHWKFPIVSLHNENHYTTLTATALRTSQVVSTKDIQVDPRLELLRHTMPQIPYHGMAVIPFQQRGKPIGVFILFSHEGDLFEQTDEISLLNEMSLDISFALDTMESEKERRQAEQKVTYQARLLENINDAVLATDVQFRITSWNHAAELLYGYKENEVIGLKAQDVIRSEFSNEQRSEAVRNLTEKGSFRVEIIQYHRDGHSFWVDGSTFIIRDEAGHAEGYISINRDITQRKAAEAQVLSLSKFPEEDPSPVFRFSKDGMVQYANQAGKFLLDFWKCEVSSRLPADLQRMVSDTLEKGKLDELEVTCYDRIFTIILVPVLDGGYINGYGKDITESKHAENDLRENEERLRLSLLAANQGLYDLNVQTGNAIVNRQYAEMLGYDFETFVETNAFWIERLHPDDREITAKAYRDYIDGLLPEYRVEFRQRMKDGKWKWILSLGKVVEYDAQGNPQRMLGTHTDITERKKAEEALRQNEHVLRLFVEHSPASIAMFDREMRYIVASRRYLIDYRLSVQDIAGRSHYEIFPEIPERWKEIHRRCLAGATESAEEDPFPREDGTLDWVRWEIRPWYEEPEKIGGIILFSEVITERKQAQELVRNRNRMLLTLHQVALQVGSELRLPNLLANVLGEAQSLLNADRGGGVYLYEPDTQSLRLAHGTGINRERDGITVQIGKGVAGRVYQTAQPLIVDDYTNWEGHASILVQDPPSTVMGVPLFVENKVIGVLTFIANSKFRKFNALDVQQAEMFAAQVAIAIQNAQLYHQAQNEIAERAKAQEELHLLNAQLEQRVIERTAELQHANRAKDEFLANMSHELRTPLNTVLGLSETLLEQRKGPLNEKQSQALGMISSSGQHLLGIINDILEVTKIEAGKIQIFSTAVPVKELCESSLNFIKEMALKKAIHLEYINNESISTVHADPQRLKQILINLLTNAVKFTPERGSVSLKVSVNREKEQIQFSVTDTGIGIAPGDMKKLFTPFTQLDSSLSRQYGGTGLGLALVQKLTDLHDGSVKVESEPDKGSCFTIYLPWNAEEGEQNQISSANDTRLSADAPHGAREAQEQDVILLAEDNAANIITFSDYLEAQGYKVVIAYDGREAVEKAKSLLPDIILMDIQMPTMSGLEATAILRSDLRFATTPIIALTALAMPGDRERCIAAGADEYMSKPVSLRELAKTIKRLLPSDR